MRVLRSGNLWVRSAGLCLLGIVILFTAWSLSYRALPERIVEGKSAVYYAPIMTDETVTTFIRIFLWNIGFGCIPLAIANLINVREFSLSYALSSYHWAMYGILLGTNSFIVPGPGRLLPSVSTLLYGTGIYEIAAYSLIASSTYYLHVHSKDFFKSVKEHKWSTLKPSKSELGLMIFAVMLLAASNYLEAWRMFHG